MLLLRVTRTVAEDAVVAALTRVFRLKALRRAAHVRFGQFEKLVDLELLRRQRNIPIRTFVAPPCFFLGFCIRRTVKTDGSAEKRGFAVAVDRYFRRACGFCSFDQFGNISAAARADSAAPFGVDGGARSD